MDWPQKGALSLPSLKYSCPGHHSLATCLCWIHGRRSVGGQEDISPTFSSGGMPRVLPHYFFGGRHFCTNAHGIHWIVGAIFVKLSQLILMKIIKIVVIRCQI